MKPRIHSHSFQEFHWDSCSFLCLIPNNISFVGEIFSDFNALLDIIWKSKTSYLYVLGGCKIGYHVFNNIKYWVCFRDKNIWYIICSNLESLQSSVKEKPSNSATWEWTLTWIQACFWKNIRRDKRDLRCHDQEEHDKAEWHYINYSRVLSTVLSLAAATTTQ